MKNVTYYSFPYPKAEPVKPDVAGICPAQVPTENKLGVYFCTREEDHPSRHEAAGVGGRLLASWPRDES